MSANFARFAGPAPDDALKSLLVVRGKRSKHDSRKRRISELFANLELLFHKPRVVVRPQVFENGVVRCKRLHHNFSLTTGVELGKACPEPTDLMEMRLVPVEEGVRMAREGKITEEPSALVSNQPGGR